MIDPTEFYGIACSMVKAWPATYPNAEAHEYVAKRPNTFAVLRSLLEIEAANLNKTIEHARPPYFFVRGYDSNELRSGIKIEYPLLGCAEDTMTFFNPIYKGVKKQRHKINAFVIDQLPDQGKTYSDKYSMNRAVEEVGRDLRQIMLRFLHSLTNWQSLEFSAGPYVDGWHDAVWLAAHGDPTAEWEIKETFSQVASGMGEVSGDLIYTGSDNTVVLITNIYIDTDYCPAPVDFNYQYGGGGSLVQPVEKWLYDV
jgi:hypothetical protein